MKKQSILLLIASFVLLCVACSDDKEESNNDNNVAFEDYNLTGLSCEWQGLEHNKIYLINTRQELEAIVSCAPSAITLPPVINFDTHTLIVLQGQATSGISKITKSLIKNADDFYLLQVIITTNETSVAPTWVEAIVTKKIAPTTEVGLFLIHHQTSN